ncbi:MAG: hypothetical protein KA314_06905 [Chloroflexi bacterium]|nr:hypothetical protein [Chloroflexota bacterium]MBP8055554.1 hypothetical protein [Chloroflexota bacterium]
MTNYGVVHNEYSFEAVVFSTVAGLLTVPPVDNNELGNKRMFAAALPLSH